MKLRLFKSRERLEALLQHAAEKELAYSDFLEQVLGQGGRQDEQERHRERAWRASRSSKSGRKPSTPATSPRSTRRSAEPCQLPLHRARRQRLRPRPARGGQDRPLRGPRTEGDRGGLPGVRAPRPIPRSPCRPRRTSRDASTKKLKLYTTPRLLIIDEIGDPPIDRLGAVVLPVGQVATSGGPTILTSNQSFGAWGEVFGDRVIATAILDRLLHHAVTLNIRGNRPAQREAQGRPGARRGNRIMNRVGRIQLPHLGKFRLPLTVHAWGRRPSRTSTSGR